MADHWRFLELSLPTPDIVASLDFYRRLGFTEINTSDVRGYPYAVVSDSRIAIGLHAARLPAPALSFSQNGAARWARQLEAAGFELAYQQLGIDDFHEFAITSPSGHLAVVMEAPTFSRQQALEVPAPLTGASAHIEFGCYSLDDSIEFWQLAGLHEDAEDAGIELDDAEATIQVEGEELFDEADVAPATGDQPEEPAPTERDEVELAAPLVRLHMVVRHDSTPRLYFPSPDIASLRGVAERFGLKFLSLDGQQILTAPEGTLLAMNFD